MLITLEGIDGSGKSTLCTGLKERLKDLNPVFTKEPGSSLVNAALRKEIVENRDPILEATLFIVDHAAHLVETVLPALKENKLVICDRYIDSRFVYQELTLEGILDNPRQWLQRAHSGWSIAPDVTFYIAISPAEANRRILARGTKLEHFEELDFLEKADDKFRERIRNNQNKYMLVDGSESPTVILDAVERDIRRFYTKGDIRFGIPNSN